MNGLRWDGLPRFFFSADVIQLAACPDVLQYRGVVDLRLRMREHQATHFPADGPNLDELRGVPECRVVRFLERHFRNQFEALERPLGPWRPCPHVVIIGHGMPVLRVTVGMPFAPTADTVQRYFDAHLHGHFSCRRIVDTKWASHNAYVFFAAAPWSHSTVWMVTIGDELDAFELHEERHSLASIPLPAGFELRPAECVGPLGVASLRRVDDTEPTVCPGFLKCMAAPPYPLLTHTVDLEEDSSPSFAVPGAPDEPPPISSSDNTSSSARAESVCSADEEPVLELAPAVESSPSDGEEQFRDPELTVDDVFGADVVAGHGPAAAGASLLQTHIALQSTAPGPSVEAAKVP